MVTLSGWSHPVALHRFNGAAQFCFHLFFELIPAGRFAFPGQVLTDELLLLIWGSIKKNVKLIFRTKREKTGKEKTTFFNIR